MRYRPKSVVALHIALGGLPGKMRVEVDRGIEVSATTVGELRKLTLWPENLVIAIPTGGDPERRGKDQQGYQGDAHVAETVERPCLRADRVSNRDLIAAGAIAKTHADR